MEQPIERYLNVQQAYYPSVAANGEQIAFISTITGTPQVWQVARSADGQVLWPDQLTFDADRVLGVWCSPAPGDGRLIYAADRGGNENAQLFLLDPNGGEERALTAGYDDAMHTFGAWSAAIRPASMCMCSCLTAKHAWCGSTTNRAFLNT
jgi:Tol biopolymer transport system component